jgi:hypothetical protein
LIDKQYQITEEDGDMLQRKYYSERQKDDKAELQKVLMGDFKLKNNKEIEGIDDFARDSVDRRVYLNHNTLYRSLNEWKKKRNC